MLLNAVSFKEGLPLVPECSGRYCISVASSIRKTSLPESDALLNRFSISLMLDKKSFGSSLLSALEALLGPGRLPFESGLNEGEPFIDDINLGTSSSFPSTLSFMEAFSPFACIVFGFKELAGEVVGDSLGEYVSNTSARLL